MKRGNRNEPHGLWLINKPKEMSSFGVVSRLRRALQVKKIGHAGTLDPLATGLMLLLVGKEFTKQADSLLKLDKSYRLEFTLGATTETDDAEMIPDNVSDRQPTRAEVDTAIASLTGQITQLPPDYSAIKVGGKRAYKLARQGEKPVLMARPVTVYSWQDVEYDYPYIRAEVSVSSGTYIRALARDLGEKLGVGAYLSALQRTKIGEYVLTDAVELENIA